MLCRIFIVRTGRVLLLCLALYGLSGGAYAAEPLTLARAEQLMAEHLRTWQDKLHVPAEADPLAHLREALAPVGGKARDLHTSTAPAPPTTARKPRADRSTYLGDVL